MIGMQHGATVFAAVGHTDDAIREGRPGRHAVLQIDAAQGAQEARHVGPLVHLVLGKQDGWG